MDSFHLQREYGAAVEAHYGLKNVTKVSMPTNEHDEPLVVHISMLVSKEDIKGIAARFAGEVPAKTSIREFTVKLDPSTVQDAISAALEMVEPGGILLPASAVEKLKRFGYVNVDKMVEFGGIVAK